VIRLSFSKKVLLILLTSLLLFPSVVSPREDPFGYVENEENYTEIQELDKTEVSSNIVAVKAEDDSIHGNFTEIFQGGIRTGPVSLLSNSENFTRHMMCKDHRYWQPIHPTTIFKPSDERAYCLTTVLIWKKIEFRWFYRSNTSKNWIQCYSKPLNASPPGEWHYFAGYLKIAGQGLYYPRAYTVDVYLDDTLAFSEFFEITNGGLNSPRLCEDVIGESPVNMKSRFTIGLDTKVHHFFKLDKIAYFNQRLEHCHNFTTIWIQPDGRTYKKHSASFYDYKDVNITWNYWQHGVSQSDYIIINSSTPIGNWKVEVYIDSYFLNSTWSGYGPVATTPFMVGNETVADWTFMVYLDGDNNLETAGIEVFLKLAYVGSSSDVNIVVQMDRILGWNQSYGDWTGCMRFHVTNGMTPMPGNATMDLGEVNMGNPDTLNDFVNWTMHFFPANYYTLVLWDHGLGCMGFCFDLTSDDYLSSPEVSRALSDMPGIIDILFLDACSMSMIEIAYQIKDYANVLIGPEGIGYSPGPYDYYLLRLTSNSSILPNTFVEKIVDLYLAWCGLLITEGKIQNATMSATDLTKITALMASLEDFALTLKDKETPHMSLILQEHEHIISARTMTHSYRGPYQNDTNNYVDLYHFAQLIRQYTSNEELQTIANQLMIRIKSAIIKAGNRNHQNSNGLAIFFPIKRRKYTVFGSEYNQTAFVKQSAWDEFLSYHLSAHVLTIQTPHPDIPIEVLEDSSQLRLKNTTDLHGRISIFVPTSNYTINITDVVMHASSQRRVFTKWNDNYTSNLRTQYVDETLTLQAEYEDQYQLLMNANFGTTNPSIGLHWYKANSTFEISATPPDKTQGERYILLGWAGTGNGSYNSTDNLTSITMHGPINETAVWKHEYFLSVESMYGSPSPVTGWFEAGKSINASIESPVPINVGTRYVCKGWTGTGNISSSGAITSVDFMMTEPSNLTWNWKIQYLLTVNADPTGIGIQPSISPPGPWYDNGTVVNCTSQEIEGYSFNHWNVDGTNWDQGQNTINIIMTGPHEATLYYMRATVWWEQMNMFLILGLLGIVVTAVVIGATWIRKHRRKEAKKGFEPEIEIPEFLPDRVPVGHADLDKLLLGGIPQNFTVIITSPSCDERDLLIKRYLETGVNKGEITFYITTNPGQLKTLAEAFQSNFYLFICNPRADMIIKDLPNVSKLKGVENLTQISIELTKAYEKAGVNSANTPKRAFIEIVSDVLLQHGPIKIRRWLTDLITELKSRSFTTLAVMDPQMHSPQEVHAILDLFEGEIDIYEKEAGTRFLKIKKMYNENYIECELRLKKEEKLE
jgi:KaiC/GvpD/RAD55 family RecA-like ATPase